MRGNEEREGRGRARERRREWLIRLSPPGYDAMGERRRLILWSLIALAVTALIYPISLAAGIDRLYVIRGTEKLLIEGEKLYYTEVMGPFLMGTVVPMALSLIHIRRRRRYFYEESQSIYTMRRLGHPEELWLRITVAPAVSLLASLAATGLLILITLTVYRIAVPAQCIPQDNEQVLVRQLAHWWLLMEP